MHTHPWIKGEEYGNEIIEGPECIRKNKLFHLSSTDHESEYGSYFEVNGKKFSVAVVMTLFSTQKANDKKDNYVCNDGTIEFSIGNLKIWLFAQAFQHIEKSRLTQQQIQDSYRFYLKLSNYTDDDLIPIPITTDLNGLDIMDWVLFKPFGRIKIEDNDAEYVERKSSEKRYYY